MVAHNWKKPTILEPVIFEGLPYAHKVDVLILGELNARLKKQEHKELQESMDPVCEMGLVSECWSPMWRMIAKPANTWFKLEWNLVERIPPPG